ncbi:MAG: TrmH family RNA methyltransferase [Candidatus Paceibacterota bacterium]
MIVILYNIRSTHNVGSILRTADAIGVEKIYLCGITPDPIDLLGRPRADIVKASLGAEKTVPWEHIGHSLRPQAVITLITKLKEQGYIIISLEQHQKSTLLFSYKKSPKQKIALIVGNEVSGVSQSILSHSDTIIEIPMHGTKESLNVSVAFGIAGFHLSEQSSKR